MRALGRFVLEDPDYLMTAYNLPLLLVRKDLGESYGSSLSTGGSSFTGVAWILIQGRKCSPSLVLLEPATISGNGFVKSPEVPFLLTKFNHLFSSLGVNLTSGFF